MSQQLVEDITCSPLPSEHSSNLNISALTGGVNDQKSTDSFLYSGIDDSRSISQEPESFVNLNSSESFLNPHNTDSHSMISYHDMSEQKSIWDQQNSLFSNRPLEQSVCEPFRNQPQSFINLESSYTTNQSESFSNQLELLWNQPLTHSTIDLNDSLSPSVTHHTSGLSGITSLQPPVKRPLHSSNTSSMSTSHNFIPYTSIPPNDELSNLCDQPQRKRRPVKSLDLGFESSVQSSSLITTNDRPVMSSTASLENPHTYTTSRNSHTTLGNPCTNNSMKNLCTNTTIQNSTAKGSNLLLILYYGNTSLGFTERGAIHQFINRSPIAALPPSVQYGYARRVSNNVLS